MPMLSEQDTARVERAITEIERRCGVQIVAAVVQRADDYPEVPWRAFSIGCAVAAFTALAMDIGRPDWMSTAALLAQALVILGSGGLAAMATFVAPWFARLFVREARFAEEVRQRAESMFLARDLSATSRRDALLILVSLFERRVVVVPDIGYRGRVTADDWTTVIDGMTPDLGAGRVGDAVLSGLAKLEAMLKSKGFAGGAYDNALPDALVQGESA